MDRDIYRHIGYRKYTSLLILSCMILIFSLVSLTFWGSGNHVQAAEPTVIMNANDLNNIRNDLDGDYILGANIDLGISPYNVGAGWNPIGTSATKFKGSFDGASYTISGLKINRVTDDVGLFGHVANAKIKNVTLTNVNVRGGKRVGGLVGYEAGENGEVTNSSVSGIVNATSDAGGLIGKTSSVIKDSSSTAKVTGERYVGGLVGETSGKVADSFSAGTISASDQVIGGLVGYSNGKTIIDSYASGNVTGGGFAGGLVGIASPADIITSYATGNVVGTEYVGGLVARVSGTAAVSSTITGSYATGTVSGVKMLGGLAGNANATIAESYATGNVTGTERDIGGLVGELTGSDSIKLLNTYASGSVTGGSSVGALVGYMRFSSIVNNSYATAGTLPLVGVSAGPELRVFDSFYNKGTTANNDPKRGIAKTPAEMQQRATFTNWDFDDVWVIEENSGYPRLQRFEAEPDKEIIGFELLNDTRVEKGNVDLNDLNLPTTVQAKLDDNSTIQLSVVWNNSIPPYDKNLIGTYMFTGVAIQPLPPTILNTANHTAKVNVIIHSPSTDPESTIITFDDIVNHWARTDIELLASKGIVKGITDKRFAPNQSINRAEFTALLVRGLDIKKEDNNNALSFTDVDSNAWYAEVVQTAVQAGLIQGYPDDTFRPTEKISREELATLIHRVFNYLEQQVPIIDAQQVLAPYQDQKQIGDWAVEAVAFSVHQGIIQGVTTEEIAPKKQTTRAESAVVLKRLLDKLGLL